MTMTLEQIVAQDVIEYYDCVAVNIDATHNYYYTQAPYNLTLSDNNTYQAAGGLLGIDDFVDNANFSIERLNVSLAGIVDMEGQDSALKTIQELQYIDKPLTIFRAFIVDHAVEQQVTLYKGYIDNISATFAAEGDATQVDIQTSSHWTDFDRVSSRYTNTKSQQELYPSDTGFAYAVDVQKEVVWREAA